MRRVRKTRSPATVSLFPFLAVLICTLGVLIVMLVIAAKQADQSAQQAKEEASQDVQSTIDQLEDQLEGARIKIDGITRARVKGLERFKLSRDNHSRLRNEVRQLSKQVMAAREELVVAIERLEASDDQLVASNQNEFDPSELDELRKELQRISEETDQKKTVAPKLIKTRYVIAPYRGGGGTFRRPIFIECLKDELRIQPLGIVLSKSEFNLPLAAGNMLDAALLTVREYWQQHDLAGEFGSPYPLLVVRPDGAETFVLARRAMKSWDDEFGYELVRSDREIDFGNRDEQLAAEVKQAIEMARLRQQALAQRRQALHEQRGGFASGSQRTGYRVSGSAGGFVQDGSEYASSKPTGPSIEGAQALKDLKRQINGGAPNGKGDETTGTGSQFSQNNRSQSTIQDRSVSRTGHEASLSKDRFDSQAGRGRTGQHQTTRSLTQQANGSSSSSPTSQPNGGNGEQGMGSPFADLSLAGQRGSGWALPTRTTGAVGYVRPIRLICFSDRMELVRSTNGNITIPFDDQQMTQSVDKLINEIWKQVDQWGTAGAGNYWKPQLRVTVVDQGKVRFQQLQGLLFDSGIAVNESADQLRSGGGR
ncbi:MAG: hypothetical protein AAFN77_17715 [Planctomycetota bacterium]